MERKSASGWVDDGVWEHLVVVEPRRVICRRPSTKNVPARRRREEKIPPRVKIPARVRKTKIPGRVRRRPPEETSASAA